MQQRLLAIILSIGAAGLGAAIVAVKRSAPSAVEEQARGNVSQLGEPRVKYKTVRDKSGALTSQRGFHWSEVESSDYKDYIAKLRAINCPEETIRDIIMADVNKLYAPREAALKLPSDEEDSVSSDRSRRIAPFERRKQLREIQKEKNALLKELLGIELPLEPLRARGDRNYALFDAAFKSLPAEKRESVREIQENYWQASDALKDKYNNKRTAEYIEEYKRINLERKAQLANVLTADEMDEYEMRTTNVAQNMQNSLDGFNPSEEEFRAIFRIRKTIEEPYGGLLGAGAALDSEGNMMAQAQRSYADREREMTEKIKETLGPDRAREYELARDSSYRTMKRLGERFGLTPEAVTQSYELQRNYREQQRQLRSNSTLTPEQRNAALQELSASHQTQFKQIVGERAANAYRGNRGSYVENGVIYSYE